MKISISDGNSKLGKVPNISLLPVADCANCELCSQDCYALKAFRMYPSVRLAWQSNSAAAHQCRSGYFALIRAYLGRKAPRFFRWHVAGDILDQNYFAAMADIAADFPKTKFLCFSKRFDLDFAGRPGNLQIVLSRWPGDTCPATHSGLPMAWMDDGTESRIPSNAIECPGGCDTCGMCFSLSSIGRDVRFRKH